MELRKYTLMILLIYIVSSVIYFPIVFGIRYVLGYLFSLSEVTVFEIGLLLLIPLALSIIFGIKEMNMEEDTIKIRLYRKGY